MERKAKAALIRRRDVRADQEVRAAGLDPEDQAEGSEVHAAGVEAEVAEQAVEVSEQVAAGADSAEAEDRRTRPDAIS